MTTLYSPETFLPDKVHCPGCHAPQAELSNQCEHCGYTARQAVEKFPFEAPPLTTLIDPDGRLARHHRQSIRSRIQRLERHFPQVTIYVALAKLPEESDVREFGYWLFNASPVENPAEAERRLDGILLVVDRTSRTASLTVGYGLDVFLGDDVLTALLDKARPHFKGGSYGRGIIEVVDALRRALLKAHGSAMKVLTAKGLSLQTP